MEQTQTSIEKKYQNDIPNGVIPENHPIYKLYEIEENHNELIVPFPFPTDDNYNEDGLKHFYISFNYSEEINGDIVYHSEEKWYSKFSINGTDINLYCKKKYTSKINDVSRITIQTSTFNYLYNIITFDEKSFPIFNNQLKFNDFSVNHFPIQKFYLND